MSSSARQTHGIQSHAARGASNARNTQPSEQAASPFSEMLDSAQNASSPANDRTLDKPAAPAKSAKTQDSKAQDARRTDRDTAKTADAKGSGSKNDTKNDTKATDDKSVDDNAAVADDAMVTAEQAAATDAASGASIDTVIAAVIAGLDTQEAKPADDKPAPEKKTDDAEATAIPTQVVADAPALAPAVALPTTVPQDAKTDAPGDEAIDPATIGASGGKSEKPGSKLASPLDAKATAETADAGETAEAPKQEAKPQFVVKTDEKPATGEQPHAARLAAAAEAKRTDVSDAPKIADNLQVTQPSHQHTQATHTTQLTGLTAATAAQNTATTSAPVPLNGVAIEIATHASAGKKSFDIRLDPAELGKIDVRLEIDNKGQVTSRLVVEKAETLELLRRDAPQLERALQDAGLKMSGNGLQFSLQQQAQQQQQDNGSQNNAAQDTAQMVFSDDTIAADLVQRGYARLAAARGGIDVRI